MYLIWICTSARKNKQITNTGCNIVVVEVSHGNAFRVQTNTNGRFSARGIPEQTNARGQSVLKTLKQNCETKKAVKKPPDLCV